MAKNSVNASEEALSAKDKRIVKVSSSRRPNNASSLTTYAEVNFLKDPKFASYLPRIDQPQLSRLNSQAAMLIAPTAGPSRSQTGYQPVPSDPQ